ncbi:hypothetical protein DPMN_084198 [Dreissena polymorpha]|uniref:Uncharacterized protein n=1 Tax=Dreissena polymorpha TaxID=45954 RepID=A0A9D3YE41_DREPO|nr:hypothetical protein DPMN_084198 [Dreissena polymorpha]
MKEPKEEWIEKQSNSIYKKMKTGSSNKAYSTLKTVHPRASVRADAVWNILTESATVL